MQVASEHIAPLQDAADSKLQRSEETPVAGSMEKYRVLRNR